MKKAIVISFCLFFISGAVLAKKSSNDYKDGIGIAFDATDPAAIVRLWPSDSLGIDITAGLSFNNAGGGTMGLGIGGGLVFPLSESRDFNLNVIPGLSIGFTKYSEEIGTGSVDYSTFTFMALVSLEFEVVLSGISENLCLASAAGAGIGISSSGVSGSGITSTSTTDVSFGAATSLFISPVIIRYYID